MHVQKREVSAVLSGKLFKRFAQIREGTVELIERFVEYPYLLQYALRSVECIPIEQICFGHERDHICHILHGAKKETAQDLMQMTEEDFLQLPGMTEKYARDIESGLHYFGLVISIAPHPHDDRSVSDLDLSVRGRKAIARMGISTLGELRRRSSWELGNAKNFGETSLNELKEKMKLFGLKLRRY